jgi:hypothetical protein
MRCGPDQSRHVWLADPGSIPNLKNETDQILSHQNSARSRRHLCSQVGRRGREVLGVNIELLAVHARRFSHWRRGIGVSGRHRQRIPPSDFSPGSERPAVTHAGPWRGLCSHCGGTFQVRLDGTIRRARRNAGADRSLAARAGRPAARTGLARLSACFWLGYLEQPAQAPGRPGGRPGARPSRRPRGRGSASRWAVRRPRSGTAWDGPRGRPGLGNSCSDVGRPQQRRPARRRGGGSHGRAYLLGHPENTTRAGPR